MIVPRPALLAVEELLNPLLRLDPHLAARLGRHAGRVLALEITGLGAVVYVEILADGLRLHPQAPQPPAARVRGGPASLLRVAAGAPPAACGVSLAGDVGLVQDLAGALREADPDWEEALARLTGDVIAHQVGRGVRGLARFLAHAGEQFRLDLAEYLRDEAALAADAHAVRRWMDAVDALGEETDRLEARVRRLERRLRGGG